MWISSWIYQVIIIITHLIVRRKMSGYQQEHRFQFNRLIIEPDFSVINFKIYHIDAGSCNNNNNNSIYVYWNYANTLSHEFSSQIKWLKPRHNYDVCYKWATINHIMLLRFEMCVSRVFVFSPLIIKYL